MKNLTQGNIYKTFFLFGLPLVLSGLLSMSFDIVDKIIVGKFLGESALGATSSVSPFITLLSSIFWGYIVGFTLYEAKLFGAKDYERLKSVFYSNVLFTFLCSLVICGGSILFKEPIFNALKVNDSLRPEASNYYLVYVAGLFFITSTVTGSYTVNAFGIGGYALLVSIVSALINLIGNILSAVVFDWGLAGIAFFSVLAGFVSNILYLIKIRRCFQELGVDKSKISFSFAHVKNSFPYALPNMIQQTVMYLAGTFVSPIVNGLGVEATAGYSVACSVQSITTNAYMHSSRCLMNYAAQCAGEGNYRRINRGVRVGLVQGIAFGLPFILFCTFCPELVSGLFLKKDASLLTKEYAYLFAQRYLPFLFFHLVCNLLHALYKGIKAPGHLVSGTLVSTLSRVALSYLWISKGMQGFYSAWVASWIIEAVFVVVLYFIGLWRPDRKRKNATS